MWKPLGINEVNGRRGWTRTSDPLLRSPILLSLRTVSFSSTYDSASYGFLVETC